MTLGVSDRSQLEGLLCYPDWCEAGSRSLFESLGLRNDKRLHSPFGVKQLDKVSQEQERSC